MTHDAATELVFELIDAVRSYENAQKADRKYYREDYEKVREKVISALTSAERKP